MADFVGLLKKTIDAQSNMTPQLRQRIYERAKAAVERKLSEKPLAPQVVDEQRAILQHAIDEVEAYYLAQEGMDELLNFPFDEGDSFNNLEDRDSTSQLIDEPTVLPESNLSPEASVLPDATNEIENKYQNSNPLDRDDEVDHSSHNQVVPSIESQDNQNNHRFGIVRQTTVVSETSVLPITDQRRIDDGNNNSSATDAHSGNYNTDRQTQIEDQSRFNTMALEREDGRRIAAEQAQREAEDRARLEAIELERKEERRIAAEQAQKEAEDRARLEAIELEREEERRIAAEQAQREAEDRARLEAIELEREEERRIAAEQAQKEAEDRARLEAIELEREEERRIAAEQAQKEAEDRAKLEAIELEREEERRIAAEQAQKEAEDRAKLEAIELEREEERRIAAEQAQKETEAQALKEAEEKAHEEEELFRLAQERMRIAEQERLEAEALEKSEEEARIAAEAKAQEDDVARLEAINHARNAEEAKLEAEAKAKEEELAKQASEQHLDAKEKAVLEVDARLSIEGARTIIPRKSENSNFDPSSYRAFDGNLDIAAERDIAGSRKEKARFSSPELMPMPPLVRSSKNDEITSNGVAPSYNNATENPNTKNNDFGSSQSVNPNKKSDDGFDLVSDIFSQAARRDQKSARSHVGMIIVIIIVVLAALAAGVYLLFPSEKKTPSTTDASTANVTQGPATTPSVAADQTGTAPNTETTNNQSSGSPAEPVISTADTTTVTPDSNKGTERLMPDGREVVAGPSQQGADNGSEGTSSTQATSIVQRSANATFYERHTSVLPASTSHGIVEWKLMRMKAKDNGPDELAIRGDILIPERDLTARITIRRNDDPSIRADFLIDLSFIVPENFDGGSVADIGRVLFKAAENSTGQELTGMLPVKVDTNFFIIAVSSNASGSNRNLNLDVMRQFRWISIPVAYENGRVAEFSIDKGDFGDSIFKQVIDDWLTQNRWAQNARPANTIAPVVPNPAPAVATPEPASPQPANAAPADNTTQNTAPTSNAAPLPNNVPVPTTPATVPIPSSVPVPSAPPAQ